MKAIRERILPTDDQSFFVQHFKMPAFDMPRHFHPEYELTYIIQGEGIRYVGDHKTTFKAGDLVLLGPDLSHYWETDLQWVEDTGLFSESIVIQFKPQVCPQGGLKEFSAIQNMLRMADAGIHFPEGAQFLQAIHELLAANGFEKLMQLYKLLNKLSAVEERTLLSFSEESQMQLHQNHEVFSRILEEIFVNFNQQITLQSICEKMEMSPPAFCRFFKKRTKRTFSEYLNQIRIKHASTLLTETDEAISQIAYGCGYNSLSYFHEQFVRRKQMSPTEYRKRNWV